MLAATTLVAAVLVATVLRRAPRGLRSLVAPPARHHAGSVPPRPRGPAGRAGAQPGQDLPSLAPEPRSIRGRLDAALFSAGITWSPDRTAGIWVAAVAISLMAGTALAGAGFGVALGTLAVLSLPVGLAALHDRRARIVDEALPSFVDRVAWGLRSGASVPDAVRAAAARSGGPLGDDLAGVLRRFDAGEGFGPALNSWRDASPSRAVSLVCASLVLGAAGGGSVAPAVDGIGATLRDREAVGRELRALSSQARASAAVMAVAPVVFTALIGGADREVLSFLFSSPPGLFCLAGGLTLDTVGCAWMWHITAGSGVRWRRGVAGGRASGSPHRMPGTGVEGLHAARTTAWQGGVSGGTSPDPGPMQLSGAAPHLGGWSAPGRLSRPAGSVTAGDHRGFR